MSAAKLTFYVFLAIAYLAPAALASEPVNVIKADNSVTAYPVAIFDREDNVWYLPQELVTGAEFDVVPNKDIIVETSCGCVAIDPNFIRLKVKDKDGIHIFYEKIRPGEDQIAFDDNWLCHTFKKMENACDGFYPRAQMANKK